MEKAIQEFNRRSELQIAVKFRLPIGSFCVSLKAHEGLNCLVGIFKVPDQGFKTFLIIPGKNHVIEVMVPPLSEGVGKE